MGVTVSAYNLQCYQGCSTLPSFPGLGFFCVSDAVLSALPVFACFSKVLLFMPAGSQGIVSASRRCGLHSTRRGECRRAGSRLCAANLSAHHQCESCGLGMLRPRERTTHRHHYRLITGSGRTPPTFCVDTRESCRIDHGSGAPTKFQAASADSLLRAPISRENGRGLAFAQLCHVTTSCSPTLEALTAAAPPGTWPSTAKLPPPLLPPPK